MYYNCNFYLPFYYDKENENSEDEISSDGESDDDGPKCILMLYHNDEIRKFDIL